MTPQENFSNALGWTLVHFVWQGALIAVVLAVALVCLRGAGSRVRYAMSCAALTAMIACAGFTFTNLAAHGGTAKVRTLNVLPAVSPVAAAAPSGVTEDGAETSSASALASYLPL